MRCPRCGFHRPQARRPKVEVRMIVLEPGRISPQLCDSCERPIRAGDEAYAAVDSPAVAHASCVGKSVVENHNGDLVVRHCSGPDTRVIKAVCVGSDPSRPI